MNKPKIGLTTGTAPGWRVGGGLFTPYAQSITEAGGEVVYLGYENHSKLEDCDGLLVSGGWDIHPKHYDHQPGDEALTYEELGKKYCLKLDEQRDRYELPLVRQALLMEIPVFGICRRIQLLNVLLGHKLVPDIPSCVGNSIVHSSGKDGIAAVHKVKILPDTKISRLLPGPTLEVNSYHHQGIRAEDVAPGLKAAAMACDGIVEAVEGIDHPWLIAVQWHPEKSQDKEINRLCRTLFKEFKKQAMRCK